MHKMLTLVQYALQVSYSPVIYVVAVTTFLSVAWYFVKELFLAVLHTASASGSGGSGLPMSNEDRSYFCTTNNFSGREFSRDHIYEMQSFVNQHQLSNSSPRASLTAVLMESREGGIS